MQKINLSVIGAGWRAEFFFRIARELPSLFNISGVMTRSRERSEAVGESWGLRTFDTIDGLLSQSPEFVVVSIPRGAAPGVITDLVSRGVPVLTETPPGPDVESLAALNRLVDAGAKIQVAEQYHLQPLHAARIRIAASGLLGKVSEVQVSTCHDYHAVSLMRKLLGIRFENARISAFRFTSPIAAGPGRNGPPFEDKTENSVQTIASLDFGDRLGIYDFTASQYFSWIRALRCLVRGDRGEINDLTVRYLKDFKTPYEDTLRRMDAGQNGNLEGYYHKGIITGSEWVYENPYKPARFTDDEIAVASCLEKMAAYARGGEQFYSLAEASQDHYLTLMIGQAVKTGGAVITESQPWSS